MTNLDHSTLDHFIDICSKNGAAFCDTFFGQLTSGISSDVIPNAMSAADLILSNDLAAAKQILTQAADSPESGGRMYLNLGNIFALLGEPSHAITAYEQARHLGTNSAFIDLRIASAYELSKDYTAAEEYYTHALQSEDYHFHAAQGLISVYLSTGRINNAWQEIKNIINLYPKEYEGIHLATALYIMCNMPTKATELLNEVRPRFHRRILFHYDYIKALECAQEYDAAYEYLSCLDDELVRENLFFAKEKSNILLALGQTDSAMQCLEYICFNFSDLESMYLYSTLLLSTGNTDKALEILHEIINTYAPCLIYFKAMYLYASTLKHFGRSADSNSLYRKLYQELDAITHDNNPSVPLYILKAYCCKELGLPDKAAEFLNIAKQYSGADDNFLEFQDEFAIITRKTDTLNSCEQRPS